MRMSCSHSTSNAASTGICRMNSPLWIAGAAPSTTPSAAAAARLLRPREPAQTRSRSPGRRCTRRSDGRYSDAVQILRQRRQRYAASPAMTRGPAGTRRAGAPATSSARPKRTLASTGIQIRIAIGGGEPSASRADQPRHRVVVAPWPGKGCLPGRGSSDRTHRTPQDRPPCRECAVRDRRSPCSRHELLAEVCPRPGQAAQRPRQ